MIVIAAAAGSALAGIVGLLLAPPIAGVTRVALEAFYRERWAEPVIARDGAEVVRKRAASAAE